MKLGISGHRWRDGANWEWVRSKLDELFDSVQVDAGYTSLAPGADQIFAHLVLARGKRLITVLPVCNGGIEIDAGERIAVDRLIERSSKIIHVDGETQDRAYFNAGKRVADCVDRMVFVWDGAPSRGLGGTADIVAYATRQKKTGIILDPLACRIHVLA